MHKNIISFFSFSFITQNVWVGRIWRVEDGWDALTWGPMAQIFCEWLSSLFCFFRSKSSSLYNFLDAHANSCGHISNLLLIHCTWLCLLLACHQHNACSILFTLGNRCISCYFCSQCPTFTSALTLSKGVFKSVSNNCHYFPGPLWSGVVIPLRGPSMNQIELFNHLNVYKQMTDVKLNC